MSIQSFKTDKFKFTAFSYNEDEKEYINFKVKKNGSNINHFKIIDEDFFNNTDMFNMIKNNLLNLSEDDIDVDFDEKEITIAFKPIENAEMNIKLPLASMTNIDTKKENYILISMLVDFQKKITSMKEDKISNIKDIYSDISKSISDCLSTKNSLDIVKNNIIKILKDDLQTDIPSSDESEDEKPVLRAKKSYVKQPAKKMAKKASIELSSDDE